MARYITEIETRRPRAELFAYLSDFSNAEEWDPGVVAAERLGPERAVREGTEFRLAVKLPGRDARLTYRVTAIDPPTSVTLRAESGAIVSLDTITLADRADGGTVVRYDADLRLKGLLRLADPALGLAFGRIGDRARDGLCRALAGTIAVRP